MLELLLLLHQWLTRGELHSHNGSADLNGLLLGWIREQRANKSCCTNALLKLLQLAIVVQWTIKARQLGWGRRGSVGYWWNATGESYGNTAEWKASCSLKIYK